MRFSASEQIIQSPHRSQQAPAQINGIQSPHRPQQAPAPIDDLIARVSTSQEEEDSDVVIIARGLSLITPEDSKERRGSRIRRPKEFFSPSVSQTRKLSQKSAFLLKKGQSRIFPTCFHSG